MEDHPGKNNDENKKKMMHKEVEKLRRQEMVTLHTKLRSVLPLEYVKGKRSMSDIINEATRYIKHQEGNIKELSDRRDELRKSPKTITSCIDVAEGSSWTFDYVVVQPCLLGVEIVIGSSIEEGMVTLSRVLEVLANEGLDAVSCVSTKANERNIYTIQCEVIDPASLDVPGLQQKLMNLAK